MADSMKILREWCRSTNWGWASTLARNCWLIASLLEPSKSKGLNLGVESEAVDMKFLLKVFIPPMIESKMEHPSSFETHDSPIGSNAESNTSSTVSNTFSNSNYSSSRTDISTAPPTPLEYVHALNRNSPLRCLYPYCKKTFTNIGNLNKHVRTACKEALKFDPLLPRGRFLCSLGCGHTSAKWNVQSHEKSNSCREKHWCHKRI